VNIGLLGLGTVGQGTATILARNVEEITRRAGVPIRVAGAVVRDVPKAQAWTQAAGLSFPITTDGDALVNDPDIDIICELAGGDEPAHRWTRAALEAGKHVVTANKALIATHGNELLALAREKGVSLRFEPAVAGGIPVIKALSEGLAANRIEWLAGIINGTGNFILSEMASRGRDFDDVLAEAQALGYAEADPTFDVEGIDAAHKLAILGAIAFNTPIDFESLCIEGISTITGVDVAFAEQLGYRIKHLGIARRREHGVELRVHPALIPKKRLLANVDGVMNAVVIHGDAVGSTLHYGPGAGAEATGSAVVADLVDLVRGGLVLGGTEAVTLPDTAAEKLAALKPGDFSCPFYLRLEVTDQPGVMAAVASIFGTLEISIEAILQKEPAAPEDTTVPLILLTRTVKESRVRDAIAQLEALDDIVAPVVSLRVETLD
jgi:homoserine dehydrogenase